MIPITRFARPFRSRFGRETRIGPLSGGFSLKLGQAFLASEGELR